MHLRKEEHDAGSGWNPAEGHGTDVEEDKGEVEEIIIHSGVNRATAILHPGAVYQGRVLNTTQVRLATPSIDNLEMKVREAEAKMGIK